MHYVLGVAGVERRYKRWYSQLELFMWRWISYCDREPHQAIDVIFDLLKNLLEFVPIGFVVCEIIAQEPVILLWLVFRLLTVASENDFGCRASDINQNTSIHLSQPSCRCLHTSFNNVAT